MSQTNIKISINRKEMTTDLDNAILRALETCGDKAEEYAKDLVPFITGWLHLNITHQVDTANKTAYIGTNVEYAP